MPRPKGSKNKTTVSRTQTTTAAKPSSITASTASPVSDAMVTFERLLVGHGDTIADLLSELYEGFASIKSSVGGDAPSSKKPSPVTTGKKTPVVEEDEETEPDDTLDFDNMSVEELQEVIDEYDLDVDLDDFKRLSQKREAVLDAYDEKMEEATSEADNEEDLDEDESDEETDSDVDDDDDDWDAPPKAASKPKRSSRNR